MRFALAVGTAVLVLILSQEASAKRTVPQAVQPVVRDGVKYTVEHFGWSVGREQNGGYVNAWDEKTGEKLWELKIYDVTYDPALEADVQDIFITELSLNNHSLVVLNERGERYVVDLETRNVHQEAFALNRQFDLYLGEKAVLRDESLLIRHLNSVKLIFENPFDELYRTELELQDTSSKKKKRLELSQSTTGAHKERPFVIWQGYKISVLAMHPYHRGYVTLTVEKP